ncbi:putative transaminase [Medicago truncatula]|uniref:Putative transaminase n=1 Tax=Medicago truncatula TaxID=3880 RepID=A0A396HX17_MEDTR|nr:putative transaminase [Medicago truncatula]
MSPGYRTISFLIGQFSLLWIEQQKRLNFKVDVVESEWGQGANLEALELNLLRIKHISYHKGNLYCSQ